MTDGAGPVRILTPEEIEELIAAGQITPVHKIRYRDLRPLISGDAPVTRGRSVKFQRRDGKHW